MSLFSWQGQILCGLSLAFIIDWRVVLRIDCLKTAMFLSLQYLPVEWVLFDDCEGRRECLEASHWQPGTPGDELKELALLLAIVFRHHFIQHPDGPAKHHWALVQPLSLKVRGTREVRKLLTSTLCCIRDLACRLRWGWWPPTWHSSASRIRRRSGPTRPGRTSGKSSVDTSGYSNLFFYKLQQ